MLAAASLLDAGAADLADAAAAAGFDGIGLRLSAEHRVDRDQLDALRERIAGHGLVVHDAEVHRIDGRAAPPDALIDAAAAVGARHLLIVSDLADVSETKRRLADVAERCRAAGITPAVEYMAWTTPSRPRGALDMANATGCVVVVDALHHHRVGATADDLTAIVDAGVFGWLQLCDAPADAPPDALAGLVVEARHQRLAPGDGELPLADLLERLPDGAVVSVEVQSDELGATLEPTARAALLAERARAVLGHANRTG